MAMSKNTYSVYSDEYHVKQRMEEDTRNYSSQMTAFQAEATLDLKYYAGDQYTWNTIYDTDDMNRKFVFNLIRRIVEMPAGHQIQNRKALIAIPAENGDQQTSDQFSKIFSYVERKGNLQNLISDAFTFGTLVTGLNLIEVFMDYTQDPISGDIGFDRIGHSAIIMDPFFKKFDLSDCSSIRKRSFVTSKQAGILLPDYKKEVENIKGTGDRDGKFQYMPENANFDVSNLLAYDEYYYMDSREQTVIIDKETLDKQEWVGSDEMLRFVLQQSPQLTVYKQTIPSVKQAILLQDRLFYEGPTLAGIDSYPFVPFLGYFSPELRDAQFRIQGMIRALRDSQFLFNRRQVISLDMLESKSTTGYVAVEGSVIDPESLYKTGQGQVIWRTKGSMPDDVQPINPPDITPGIAKLTEDMQNLVTMISGLNDEAMGQADDDIPGILSMMRQGKAMTVLRKLFNNVDSAQILLGNKILELVQKNFTPSKVKRIIEEEPTPEFYNKNFGKYDVVVEEGFYTSTQRQQGFAQALQFKQLGFDFPALDKYLFENATLQDKNKLIEGLKQFQEQQQQQQQMENQLKMQETQAGIDMAKARAAADEGMAIERMSRIAENQQMAVERSATAIKDREQALLNKAKTLKELQEVDLRQVEQIIKIAKMLQEDEKEELSKDIDKRINLADKLKEINKKDTDSRASLG